MCASEVRDRRTPSHHRAAAVRLDLVRTRHGVDVPFVVRIPRAAQGHQRPRKAGAGRSRFRAAGGLRAPIALTLALLLPTSVRIRTRHPAGCRRGGESIDQGGRTSHGPCLPQAAARASEAMPAWRWHHLAASNGDGVFGRAEAAARPRPAARMVVRWRRSTRVERTCIVSIRPSTTRPSKMSSVRGFNPRLVAGAAASSLVSTTLRRCWGSTKPSTIVTSTRRMTWRRRYWHPKSLRRRFVSCALSDPAMRPIEHRSSRGATVSASIRSRRAGHLPTRLRLGARPWRR